MSSWAQPAPSVSAAGWLDVFTRLQPELILCSGIYKNSLAITKRCQARAPENIGYLISAVKVSQAEFNKKSKVPKLDKNYKACDCPSTSTFLCVRPDMASLFVVRAASRRSTFKHSHRYILAFVFGFERGLELIMVILWVIAGFVPLWSVHLCCDRLSFGMNLPACLQFVWLVTIDLSAISLPCFEGHSLQCVISHFQCLLKEDGGKK